MSHAELIVAKVSRIIKADIQNFQLCQNDLHCVSLCWQLSYAVGIAEPLAVFITTYGTGVKPDDELLKIVEKNFDLRPGKIVQYVN